MLTEPADFASFLGGLSLVRYVERDEAGWGRTMCHLLLCSKMIGLSLSKVDFLVLYSVLTKDGLFVWSSFGSIVRVSKFRGGFFDHLAFSGAGFFRGVHV
jgi:hypothetical protein